MSTVLVAAGPGSAMPFVVLPVVRALRGRGYDVVVLTDPSLADEVCALGAGFVALETPTAAEGRPSRILPGLQQIDADLRDRFLRPLPEHWALVQQLIEAHRVDAVVADPLLLGASLLGVLPPDRRPPLLVLGTFPLAFPDPEVPPFGLGLRPLESGLNRLRNAILRRLVSGVLLRDLNRDLDRAVHGLTGRRLPGGITRTPMLADAWAQLTVPRLEYPRSRMPVGIHFVGPLEPLNLGILPGWWLERDERPVVHVCHEPGTDPRDLVVPAVRALADSPVQVVVTAGDDARRVETLLMGRRPANVRIERTFPFAHLLPSSGLMITQGNPVIVQYALRFGVPLVVAGTAEHQLEGNARVAWSGAGIDLRCARPRPEAIRAAVAHVLVDPAIRGAVARIAAQIAGTDPLAALCDITDELIADRRGAARRSA